MPVTVAVAKPANVLSIFWQCGGGRAGILGAGRSLEVTPLVTPRRRNRPGKPTSSTSPEVTEPPSHLWGFLKFVGMWAERSNSLVSGLSTEASQARAARDRVL